MVHRLIKGLSQLYCSLMYRQKYCQRLCRIYKSILDDKSLKKIGKSVLKVIKKDYCNCICQN